jgi:molecular chaperone DnaJ
MTAKEISIQITPGVSDEQLVKLTRAGEAGERGAEPGDLYIRIKIEPHKIFQREGDDLIVKKEVSLLDVLLGTKIEISTIGGNKLYVEVPTNFSLKEKLKISGEGMTRFGGFGRGDLYVDWDVKTPKKLNSKAKKILEDLKQEL